MPQYVKAIAAAEVGSEQGKLVELQGRKIAVFNVGGSYYAIDDTCTHRGGPLSEGECDGHEVTCPWHGAIFDVRTGEVVGGPAQRKVASYPVRLSGADLEIEL